MRERGSYEQGTEVRDDDMGVSSTYSNFRWDGEVGGLRSLATILGGAGT